jgi:flagellar hook protein FlgE
MAAQTNQPIEEEFMGIHHSLYSGVSGLASNSDGMNVISNNIANANTRGFKGDRAEFEDLLSLSLNENSQLGRGSRLRNITTSFTQGALSNTGGITDLGIQGDGFFMVKNPKSEIQESGGMLFTRQGSFRFDKDGFVSDVNGGRVQGYMADNNGKLDTKLTDVQVSKNSLPPQATNVLSVAANLDIREKPLGVPFDINNAKSTSNFSTTVTVYDSFGTGHATNVYFQKQDVDGENKWKWYATVNGNEVEGGPGANERGEQQPAQIGEGDLEFDVAGNPVMKFRNADGIPTYIDGTEKSDAIEVKFAGGAMAQKIQFNFGSHEDENGSLSTQTTTSIASKSMTHYHSQNGYEAGFLKTIKVDLDGSLRGVYTNGLERRLGAVALSSFSSNAGLQKVGKNSFIATPRSGEPRVGIAQSGTRGSIFSASLEESNVDLAQQFVDMIVTQRGFQANSKTITTTDTLLEEVLGLKR